MAGLSTTTSTGSQQTTGSPQNNAPSTVYNGISTGSIQSGNAVSYLNSGSGLQLTPTALSTVSLGTSSEAASSASPTSASHHINAGLLSVAVVLFLVAVFLFWQTSKSSKNTTDNLK